MSLFDALGICDEFDVGDLGSFSQPFCDVWFSLLCTFYPNVRSTLAFDMVGKRAVFFLLSDAASDSFVESFRSTFTSSNCTSARPPASAGWHAWMHLRCWICVEGWWLDWGMMTFPSFFPGNPGWSGFVVIFPVFLLGSTSWFCFLFVVHSIRWRRKEKDRSTVHRNQEDPSHTTPLDQRTIRVESKRVRFPCAWDRHGMGPTDVSCVPYPTHRSRWYTSSNHTKTCQTRRNETHHGRRFLALRRPTARWMEAHGRTRSRS